MTFPAPSKPGKWGIPGKRTVENEPIMASKLFKRRHHSDTPGRKRRAILSTFFYPRPLKYRKLDPKVVEKVRDNTATANQTVPFGQMTPTASAMIPVNAQIGNVAKGSVLHMQLKDFNLTPATSTGERTSILQPKPCATKMHCPACLKPIQQKQSTRKLV